MSSRRISIKNAVAFCLVLAATFWLVSLGLAEGDSTVIATWNGGRLERADHDSWRTFHQLEESPDAIRERVFVDSLAALARERGVEQERSFQLELEMLRQQVLIPVLRQRVESAVTVSDEELEILRRSRPEAFSRPRKLRLRNIYKSLGSDPEKIRARMRKIHGQLLAGADFKELAGLESESQSRFREGRLGFLAPEDLPPKIAAAVRDLTPGQISDLVEHDDGLTIFLCEDVREAKVPTADEVRDKLRKNLLRQRSREAWTGFQAELLKAAAPRIDPASTTTVLTMEGYQLRAEAMVELLALRLPDKELSDLTPAQRQRLLRTWASGVLAVRRAVELGLDRDPELASALRWRHLGALAHRELVRRVDERLRAPSDDELRRHFTANTKRYREPATCDLAVIHFGGKSDADQRQRVQEANDVARRLAAGKLTFEEAARRHSTHPSAATGGAIGWRNRVQIAAWGPVVSNALRQLEPGQQSGLLNLESGLWIFELRGQRDERLLSFEEVEDQVRQQVRNQQIRELESAVREERLKELELEIRG